MLIQEITETKENVDVLILTQLVIHLSERLVEIERIIRPCTAPEDDIMIQLAQKLVL